MNNITLYTKDYCPYCIIVPTHSEQYTKKSMSLTI